MHTTETLLLFGIISALLSILISYQLVHHIEQFFTAKKLSVVGIGLLSALAADTPEITSAITAVIGKQPDIGVGVIIGSNIFNFAALVGLPVVFNKSITFQRNTLIKVGLLAIANAIFTICVGARLLPGVTWFIFAIFSLIAYVKFLPDKQLFASNHVNRMEKRDKKEITLNKQSLRQRVYGSELYLPILKIMIPLILVIILSVVAEHSFAHFGHNVHLSQAIIGDIILAAITSLPNAVAAIYLAKKVSGDALISEAINSNTINVMAGILFPAAVFSSSAAVGNNSSLLWLNAIILTALLAAFYISKRISYPIAAALVLIYAGFAAYIII